MSNIIEIVEKEIGNAIEIEENVPMWKMPSVIEKDYNLLMDYLEDQKCKFCAAPYTRYLDLQWDHQIKKSKFSILLEMFTKKWHFMAGFPIPDKLEGQDIIKPHFIEKTKYVRLLHVGEYHKVGETYKKMIKWVDENDLKVKNESIEIYLNDPGDTKKEDLETEVLIPLQ